MGVCKYCGQPAGLFHSVHNGCLQLHETGTLEIMALLSHSLTGIESLSSDESELTDRIKTIGSQSFVTEAEQHDLILRALQNAVTEALKDDLLSEDEEKRLVALTQRLSLSKEELSKNPAFKRIVAAAVIRDILAGVTPRWSVTEGELHELTLKALWSWISSVQTRPGHVKRRTNSLEFFYAGRQHSREVAET
jgi:hypothetical protein